MLTAAIDVTIQRQTHFLLKKMGKAIRQYRLIDAGDRIAVAVSGGKDSLTLLHLLLAWRAVQAEPVEVLAVHIAVPGVAGSQERAHSLELHFRGLGVGYSIESLEIAQGESWPLPCYRCAWLRRKTLFGAAHRLGCNKVALGHHADDAAQTTLLNLFHQGRFESIAPSRPFFGGLITVIRPLIYLPEKAIVAFARYAGYPIGRIDCPSQNTSQRARMAILLREIEKSAPHAKSMLWRAVQRNGRQAAQGSDSLR